MRDRDIGRLRLNGARQSPLFFQRKVVMMHRMALASTMVLVACAPTRAPGAGQTVGVPVYREPHHQLVFESPLVRVLDVRVAHGDTSLFHQHAEHHAGVLISGSARWVQTLGRPGAVGPGDSVGTIFDNATSELPYTHRVANLDSVQFRLVMGQFLRQSGIVSAPLPHEPSMKLERETPHGRVYRIRLLPGQETSLHKHAQPGLTIEVSDGKVVLTGDTPVSSSAQSGAGAWWWREAGNAHSIRNAGNTPVELIEIDWK